MLKRFERGDISYEIALEIINKTISLKNEVKALVLAVSTDIQTSALSHPAPCNSKAACLSA
jgi:hypothetical protein